MIIEKRIKPLIYTLNATEKLGQQVQLNLPDFNYYF